MTRSWLALVLILAACAPDTPAQTETGTPSATESATPGCRSRGEPDCGSSSSTPTDTGDTGSR